MPVDTKEARERIEYCRSCAGSKTATHEAVMWATRLADEVDILRAAAEFERAECGASTGALGASPVMVIDDASRLVVKIETPPGYRFRRATGAAIKVGERVEEGEPVTFSGVTPSHLLAGNIVVIGKVV